jgi:hypothetical protein
MGTPDLGTRAKKPSEREAARNFEAAVSESPGLLKARSIRVLRVTWPQWDRDPGQRPDSEAPLAAADSESASLRYDF